MSIARMLEMKIHEKIQATDKIDVVRVPGGWIYIVETSFVRGQYDCTFVPLNYDVPMMQPLEDLGYKSGGATMVDHFMEKGKDILQKKTSELITDLHNKIWNEALSQAVQAVYATAPGDFYPSEIEDRILQLKKGNPNEEEKKNKS